MRRMVCVFLITEGDEEIASVHNRARGDRAIGERHVGLTGNTMKKNIAKAKKVMKSFPHAFRGLRHAFWGELNFRLMAYAAIAAIIVLGSKPIPSSYKLALVLASALLLIVELINTAIEKAMDLLLPGELEEIKYIKDMMAGAALIASVCWVIVVVYALAA